MPLSPMAPSPTERSEPTCPRGSHPGSYAATSHPLPGLLRHARVLDAELEDMVLQTRLQAVGGGATAAHVFTVAA